MQPVNEADFDSETQACVDTRDGGPASFYDHYVTKRRKKKGRKGAGIEDHTTRSVEEAERKARYGTSFQQQRIVFRCEPDFINNPEDDQATKPITRNTTLTTPKESMLPPDDEDRLQVPGLIGVQRGALSNAAIRRVACGKMPPGANPPRERVVWTRGEDGETVVTRILDDGENEVKVGGEGDASPPSPPSADGPTAPAPIE
eukprot:TRINITY_DN5950_c0_g1_i1.p1 TRINITY_DN5950_c0_g1~~TRINITY_DN5950_c0_g1_i1.p1  ORF type:complete len:202 (-),score=29.54 TRINITY_DN5950_c0_g1_i1:152-757(-)